ncbi:MAG: biotin/lipoyl-containing protein [Vicinamibacteria bacterium]
MKFKHGSQTHNVVRKSEGVFDVDGVSVQATVARSGDGRFDGRNGDRAVEIFVMRAGDQVFAQVGARSYALTVVNRAGAGSSVAAAQGGLEAPMPGRVTRVAVAVGDTVKRGQELIVVEAMKMENALVAPTDGTVKSLSVKVGDMVTPGPELIVIEIEPAK